MKFNFKSDLENSSGALVIGVPEDVKYLANYDVLDALFNGQLEAAIETGVVSTKLGEVNTSGVVIQTEFRKIYTVGLGKRQHATRTNIQKALGKLFQSMTKDHTHEAHIFLDTFTVNSEDFYYDIGLMGEMSVYTPYNYKSEKNEDELTLSFSGEPDETALLNGQIEGRAINFSRDFSEMPPNILYPESFSYLIKAEFKEHQNIQISVKDDRALLEEGYGLLSSVGHGSDRKPRLVTIEYKNSDKQPVCLVGKGITYDSGGYSLKSRNSMVSMKYDMSGAANVLGMMKTLAEQEVETHVVAILALAENMVQGDANRPDDVVISKKGLSVEISNTDAEGRLVLADAVTEATEYDPVVIMDFATLTGAVVGALGEERTGLFTNQDTPFTRGILESSFNSGEKLWELPMDELDDCAVKESSSADLINSNLKPFGGASFAAAFINQFTEDYPWLHFDIAGTSKFKKDTPYGPKAASGVMIRTVVDYIKSGKVYGYKSD